MDLIYLIIFVLIAIISFFLGYIVFRLQGKLVLSKQELDELVFAQREDAIKRSRSVLGGQFSEQLAPYLPNFKYNPTEAKFLGKPIDLIIFKGLDSRTDDSEESKGIEEIIFLEIKSGDAKLTKVEKNLRDVIQQGKVRWEEYRITKDLTKKS